jgi:glucose-1-phosphate adenylyltransferase
MFNGGFVDILAAEQTRIVPTGFRKRRRGRQSIKHLLPYEEVKYVVILSGDQLYQMDLRQVINFHIEKMRT